MMKVQLVKRFAVRGGPAFNIGERVALEDSLAASLIADGVAVRAYDAPPVDRMIDTAPVKREPVFKRKGRADVQ